MVGYTGIARMRYSVDGRPLDRSESVMVHAGQRSLDGGPCAGFKWVQYPVGGIDGRVYFTGTHATDRGGDPYSTGLSAFSFHQPEEILRLAHMSRGGSTYRLRTRILYDADGRKRQQFFLIGGNSVPAYLEKMQGKELPANTDAKIFIYECAEGQEPVDRFGFSLPVVDGTSGADCHVLSRDGRFLVTLQHNCLLTFDLATNRYVDGRRIEGDVWRFCKPDFHFNVAPDDSILLCIHPKDSAKVTFHELEVSPAGILSLRPHLTLTGPTAAAVQSLNGAVIAFTADPKGDGSYDLCLGPYWRSPDTQLRLISDFIPPRTN
jgi:hypothetical protein